jgi:DNA-binding HxlR family transcriptional regulator
MSRRPSGRRCQPVPVQVREAASLLERRWQLSIIYAALAGALRFNEFAEAVAGISPRMLSERLRDLEAAGLVRRTVIPTSPPTVEYRLTARGMRLGPVMEAMRAYAEERASDEPADEAPAAEEPVGR